MKFGMAKNSIFAILLRSPWWLSFLVAAGMFALVRLLIPEPYALISTLPFLVIGAYSGWQQLRAPSAERVGETLAAIRALGWEDFSHSLVDAFRRDGYEVKRLAGVAADLELTRSGRVSLVGCKRWKVARTGIEPLRELHAAMRARDAHECVYVAAGEISDNARAFAAEQNIRLVHDADLANLLPRTRPRKSPAL